MANNDLSEVQRNVLLALMIKAEALPNTAFGGSLKADKRKDLEKRGFIEIVGERPMSFELTQRGQDRALEELGAVPGTGTRELVMATIFDFLRRLLDHTGADPRDLFRLRIAGSALAPEPVAATAPVAAADIDKSIRLAYQSLVAKAGEYVMLDVLRDALPGVPRPDLDAALVAMNRASDVHLIPESNQKVLTPRQREAAVSVGNQQRHLLGIDA
jgi:hypothetical protein